MSSTKNQKALKKLRVFKSKLEKIKLDLAALRLKLDLPSNLDKRRTKVIKASISHRIARLKDQTTLNPSLSIYLEELLRLKVESIRLFNDLTSKMKEERKREIRLNKKEELRSLMKLNKEN